MEGKVCTKCGVWKPLEEYHKRKDRKNGRRSNCRECQKERQKQRYQNNKEYYKEYYEANKEHKKEYDKEYCEANKEHRKEYNKQLYENNKKNNLQTISNMIEQIRPIFKELNLPIYGYIYKFENIKTRHVYIGQTINPLKKRYRNGIIKGWIKERREKQSQKFLDELIEEDFEVTEILDIGFCEYHLNMLETCYIEKYDSYNNGYNNQSGNHNSNDGIKEFNQILLENNLEFIDGKLVEIA